MNKPCGRGFELSPRFVAGYADVTPPFGFNGLGELVFRRTYARIRSETGEREQWHHTLERVVNGCFSMQKAWMLSQGLPWDERRAQSEAVDMFQRFFEMKCLPPGRGLWVMGSTLTADRGCYAALNNCSFISTADISTTGAEPFALAMSQSMLGIGVGFDVEGAGEIRIRAPAEPKPYRVKDSREGWVDSLRALLTAFFEGAPMPLFEYDDVRPAGTVIRGFGGTSQGPEPLKQLHRQVTVVLGALIDSPITITAIADVFNMIGCCVVAGNVRRSAEIALGPHDSSEFLNLKNYEQHPERGAYGWASNNSVICPVGIDYSAIADRIRSNGEPGVFWLDNARDFGRLGDEPDYADRRAKGANPCVEQTLEHCELCCLAEVFPARADDLDDFLRSIKCAMLYAKTVTLGATEWPEVNEVLLRNRRIGLSLTGLAQFIGAHGLDMLRTWCGRGYESAKFCDLVYSMRFAVPRSIKLTSVKPSGTVSLLAGATPGVHFPESRFYIRRVRIGRESELVAPLREAGYPVEDDALGNKDTLVVSFPIDAGAGVKTLEHVTMWEQLALAAFLQRYWSDNMVSCTVTFDAETEGPHIATALDFYQYQLKAISFLPKFESGTFPQMPYERVEQADFEALAAAIAPLKFSGARSELESVAGQEVEEMREAYCSGDKCQRL
ncbi:hypothetical protein JKP88DRAFT_256442 [Tribonema minus]|uniref:ribonucleoside-triphosphate reductase (thioredoxin) n=1 Tax=Tribonema minus TaxID=303371 RepID=A0A836CE65_9STRA|nr:hypothetical protein JKP88DRAFT_256442 [Tribonema minus]